ncbi:hypothetical protein [Bacteroides congonensis]|uniref:hypothetical protein n=1 Tax=Bacteroides congonensis TaxID=1871006 RepID=UPI0009337C39|nr:hypothetical protein [Bacteroides congonensis]
MNELYINNNKVHINEATSIKLVDENTYFTKSGKYTFDIEVPLKGCNENLKKIGHINRLDVTQSTVNMNARLIADGHKIIDGTATVTQVTEEKMKIQILSGNAEFNFLSKFQNLYIDEMDLGGVTDENGNLYNEDDYVTYLFYSSNKYKIMYGLYGETDFVFFPVHDTQNDVVHNDVCVRIGGTVTFPRTVYNYDSIFHPGDYGGYVATLAVQPYWCFIIKKIFSVLGYTVVENQIENTVLKNAFIANAKRTLTFNQVLPHWTIAQFIEEIEHFFGVIIEADDSNKEIRIIRRAMYFDQEKVYLDDVYDEFEVDVDEERAEDISDANITYAFESVDKYLRVDESITEVIEVKKFNSYSDLKGYYDSLDDANKKKYIYESGGSQYIDYREGDSRYLRKINQFRNLTRNEEKDTIELKIIPVQMEVGESFLEDTGTSGTMLQCHCNIVRMKAAADDYNGKPSDVQDLIEGNSQTKSDRDIIELAMNDGERQRLSWVTWPPGNFKYPWGFVLTDDLMAGDKNRGFSFELNKVDGVMTMYDLIYGSTMKVNTEAELHVKFVTNKMYSPMSLFIIRNKPYICKQIEYKVDNKGIDPQKTGYFYEAT